MRETISSTLVCVKTTGQHKVRALLGAEKIVSFLRCLIVCIEIQFSLVELFFLLLLFFPLATQ